MISTNFFNFLVDKPSQVYYINDNKKLKQNYKHRTTVVVLENKQVEAITQSIRFGTFKKIQQV